MRTLLLLVLISLALASLAAVTYEDVVYCKNGDVIRGLIIDTVPNEYIKIKVNTSVITIQYDQIIRFSKEEITPVKSSGSGTSETSLGLFGGVKFISTELSDTYNSGFSGGVSLDYWGQNDLGFELAVENYHSKSDDYNYLYYDYNIPEDIDLNGVYPDYYYPYYYAVRSKITITPLTLTLKKAFQKYENGSFFYGGIGAGIYSVTEKVEQAYPYIMPTVDDSTGYEDYYPSYYYYDDSHSANPIGLHALIGYQMTNFFCECKFSKATFNSWNGNLDVGGVYVRAGYRFKL